MLHGEIMAISVVSYDGLGMVYEPSSPLVLVTCTCSVLSPEKCEMADAPRRRPDLDCRDRGMATAYVAGLVHGACMSM